MFMLEYKYAALAVPVLLFHGLPNYSWGKWDECLIDTSDMEKVQVEENTS
jgi:hypothetical protein